jgi:aminomethyltransferase
MTEFFRPVSPIQWSWISLKGPDAVDFVHRLTTVNLKAMQPGAGAPGFFLTPQGKMRAYFHLWMISREELFFEFDAGATGHWKEDLLKVIDQFHFGEKMTLESTSATEFHNVWVFGENETFSEVKPGQFSDISGVRVFNHGSSDFGKTWLTLWSSMDLGETVQKLGMKEINIEQVEAMRIAAGRPRVDSELTENTIPLEAGMREAIADNKGCYPGQEVIEKIISLGAPARRLAQIEGSGAFPAVGDVVKAKSADATQGNSAEIGKITSIAKTSSGFRALAFIRKTHAQEGIEITFGDQTTSRAKVVSISN